MASSHGSEPLLHLQAALLIAVLLIATQSQQSSGHEIVRTKRHIFSWLTNWIDGDDSPAPAPNDIFAPPPYPTINGPQPIRNQKWEVYRYNGVNYLVPVIGPKPSSPSTTAVSLNSSTAIGGLNPADVQILMKELGITDPRQLPSIEEVMTLLHVNNPQDAMDTIKEIASTENGRALIKSFLDGRTTSSSDGASSPATPAANPSGPLSNALDRLHTDAVIAAEAAASTEPAPYTGFFGGIMNFFHKLRMFFTRTNNDEVLLSSYTEAQEETTTVFDQTTVPDDRPSNQSLIPEPSEHVTTIVAAPTKAPKPASPSTSQGPPTSTSPAAKPEKDKGHETEHRPVNTDLVQEHLHETAAKTTTTITITTTLPPDEEQGKWKSIIEPDSEESMISGEMGSERRS